MLFYQKLRAASLVIFGAALGGAGWAFIMHAGENDPPASAAVAFCLFWLALGVRLMSLHAEIRYLRALLFDCGINEVEIDHRS